MSGRSPHEIWMQAVDEGERRLGRTLGGLFATGFAGGADIMLGVLALCATTGAVGGSVPSPVAHLIGSLAFGLGFVFLVVGRGELFTENFLIPVGATIARRASLPRLLRLWGVTVLANYSGIAVVAAIVATAGVVEPATLQAAAPTAERLVDRDFAAALLSGILAGAAMTLLTWLAHAAESDVARVLLALAIGYLLAIATMNHAVVGFGEIMLPMIAGTASLGLTSAAAALAAGLLGNLVGGLGLETLSRLMQARGEPEAERDVQ
jgi:formate-nitrite transporter family protein